MLNSFTIRAKFTNLSYDYNYIHRYMFFIIIILYP